MGTTKTKMILWILAFSIGSEAKKCYVCKASAIARPKNNLVMQEPDPFPGKEEVKHDCFQPQLKGYDGEYGRPHEAECQKCISIAYSVERLNEFGYKEFEYNMYRGCQGDGDGPQFTNLTVTDCSTAAWDQLGSASGAWCSINLDSTNNGNYGEIKAKYMTEEAEEKTAYADTSAVGLIWNRDTGIECYEEEYLLKNEKPKIPASTTLKHCHTIYAHSCFSSVSNYRGEEDGKEVTYSYVRRGCSAEIPFETGSIFYRSEIPGTFPAVNATMELNYCNRDRCNDYLAEWESSSVSVLKTSLLAFGLLVLFA